MKPPLDKFGEFIVQNLRDKMLGDLETLLSGGSKAPELQQLQSHLVGFTAAQKQVIRDLVEKNITTGMHDLLFAIQEESDFGGTLQVLVDGQEVAKLSDGLHGEIFGEEGWMVRFSKYPCPAEIERSRWAQEEILKMMDEGEDHDA